MIGSGEADRAATRLQRVVRFDFGDARIVGGVIDLRREAVTFADGVITERRALPGDPLGYREVDLGVHSFFVGSGLDANGFRGADYDPGPTMLHHSAGRHAYLLSETVLRADLIVNLPKWKTHKKTGVTLALKNLVGINGDKNWLPHHTVGPEGDEFPGRGALDRARSRGVEIARGLLAQGRGTAVLRWLRRAESATRGDAFIRAGNWHGNRTTWDLETGVVGAMTGPGIRTQALFRERSVGVVRKSHPLARGKMTAARYAAGRHISTARDGPDRGRIDEALTSLGLERDIAAIVGGFSTAIALARSTDLVASVPERHTRTLRAGLHSFALPIPLSDFTISMLWHPRQDADPGHRWLRVCVRSVCTGLLAVEPKRRRSG